MAVQLVANSKSVRDQVSAEEWAARVELAAGKGMIKIARSPGAGVGTVSRIKNERRAN